MTARSAQETLESLRITLQKLEQTSDPASNREDVADLKQILLNRIGELETLQALHPEQAEVAQAPAPSDLPSIAAAEGEPAKEAAESVGLDKLD